MPLTFGHGSASVYDLAVALTLTALAAFSYFLDYPPTKKDPMATINLTLAALCLIIVIAWIVLPIIAWIALPILVRTNSKIRPEAFATGCLALALAALIGLALALTFGA